MVGFLLSPDKNPWAFCPYAAIVPWFGKTVISLFEKNFHKK
jgi:hypothetical protein